MTSIITSALRQIHHDLASALSPRMIHDVCTQMKHCWRNRLLDPVTTIQLFVMQILNGNTACTHLAQLLGQAFSALAFCQARARFPWLSLNIFERRSQRRSHLNHRLQKRVNCQFTQSKRSVIRVFHVC